MIDVGDLGVRSILRDMERFQPAGNTILNKSRIIEVSQGWTTSYLLRTKHFVPSGIILSVAQSLLFQQFRRANSVDDFLFQTRTFFRRQRIAKRHMVNEKECELWSRIHAAILSLDESNQLRRTLLIEFITKREISFFFRKNLELKNLPSREIENSRQLLRKDI